MNKKNVSVIGEEYGHLTLISRELPAEGGHIRAKFRCVCGTELIRNLSSLNAPRANPPSCGCKNKKRRTVKPKDVFSQIAQDFYLGRRIWTR